MDEVQQQIRDITGDVVVSPDRLRADGQIARNGGKYRLLLVVTSGSASGTRRLESESCAHLSGAAAVVLGILVRAASNADVALSPEVLGEPLAEPQAESRPSQTTDVEPPSAAQASPLQDAKPSGEALGNASLHTAADVHLRLPNIRAALGIVPGVMLGYGLAVGAGYSGWEASLTGSYWMKRGVRSPWPGYGANLRQYSADLDFCRMWKLAAFEGGPCVRMGLTRVSASGTGDGMALKTASVTLFSAGAVLAARFHLSRGVALHIDGGPEVFAARPRLVNPAFGQIYEYPLLSFESGLGAEWIF